MGATVVEGVAETVEAAATVRFPARSKAAATRPRRTHRLDVTAATAAVARATARHLCVNSTRFFQRARVDRTVATTSRLVDSRARAKTNRRKPSSHPVARVDGALVAAARS